jgi:predicted acyltransferase
VQATRFRETAGRAATRRDRVPVVNRLRSIDVFRGVTVAAMVIVNNPRDWNNVYAPLLHAEWHGWTPTDLMFPFFLFIVGVAITLSPRSASAGTVLRRGAIIFGLGVFLSGFRVGSIRRYSSHSRPRKMRRCSSP